MANYIYAFHMPLFFMISGFCAGYSSSGLWKTVKKSLLQLFVPYIVWSFLLCWAVKYDWRDVVIANPRYWFLLVLLYIRLIHAACRYVARKCKIREWIPSVAVILLLGVLQFTTHIDIPCFSFIYYYMIYYVTGYHLCKNFAFAEKVLASKPLLAAMALVFAVWGFFFRRGTVPSFLSFLPGFLYFIPLAMTGCYVSFSLFRNYLDKECGLLKFYGVHSLGIYVVSGLLCYLLFTYVQDIGVLTQRCWPLVYVLFVLISAASAVVVLPLSRVSWLRPLIGLQVRRKIQKDKNK